MTGTGMAAGTGAGTETGMKTGGTGTSVKLKSEPIDKDMSVSVVVGESSVEKEESLRSSEAGSSSAATLAAVLV